MEQEDVGVFRLKVGFACKMFCCALGFNIDSEILNRLLIILTWSFMCRVYEDVLFVGMANTRYYCIVFIASVMLHAVHPFSCHSSEMSEINHPRFSPHSSTNLYSFGFLSYDEC